MSGWGLAPPNIHAIFQIQKPGWRRLFNVTYRTLQTEAQNGNKVAVQALASLSDLVASSA